MPYTSQCPKCLKEVLVPDGTSHDARVQCPLCLVEYSMGEILAASPPVLIVVHPGSAAVAAPAAPSLAAPLATTPTPDLAGGELFAAHRVEPVALDGEPLLFAGDEVQLVATETPATETHEQSAESAAAVPALEEPDPLLAAPGEEVHLFDEPGDEGHLFAPPPEDGHDMAGEKAEGDAWGGEWGGFKDEPAHEHDDGVALAEPGEDDGLGHVDFAAITGKAAPGSGAAEAAVVAEPGKKKKRKREANPLVRVIGIVFFGLLALPCSLVIAHFAGAKLDFLPSWVPFISNKASAPKPAVPARPQANNNPAPAATAGAATDAGKPAQGPENTPPAVAATNPAAGKGPDQNPLATPAGEQNPAKPSENPGTAAVTPPATEPGKSPALAMNEPGKPSPKTPATPEEPSPFGNSGETKPAAPTPAKPDMPPATEPDPFGAPSPSPLNEKAKPDAKPAKPEIKPDEGPAKPDMPPATEPDPFGSPSVAPLNEKTKPEAKPAPKPATPAATEPDPFGNSPEMTPLHEKGKGDKKPAAETPAKPDIKPDLFGPLTPDVPAKPEKAPAKPEKMEPGPSPAPPAELKPDAVIGPEPKPEVKPAPKVEVTPPAKPAVKPAAKPGVGPAQAPSFAAADMDASLGAVQKAATVDAKSYAEWCKLAEVVTYVEQGSDAQKQALKTLTGKVASSPEAVAAISAAAKKLLDDKSAKGGIVLAGVVSGARTKNGLSGTAIRMAGMDKPVMVFSAHPLDVAEGQKVIVFGALVADPAKNLPGYPGKQPIVVWADFATAMP